MLSLLMFRSNIVLAETMASILNDIHARKLHDQAVNDRIERTNHEYKLMNEWHNQLINKSKG